MIGGFLIVLLLIVAVFTREDEGCYKKSFYNCIRCKKCCKYRDTAKFFDEEKNFK